MAFALFHRALDDLAVWSEDHRPRRPEPLRLADPESLECFGPLPAATPSAQSLAAASGAAAPSAAPAHLARFASAPPASPSLTVGGPAPDTPDARVRSHEHIWTAPSPYPLRPGDRMSVRVTPARGPRRATAILVPPWKIASPRLVAGYAKLLSRAGQEVWLVCPPHHLDRTLPGARSGEGFVSLDLHRFRAVFEQLVLEIRVLVALASRLGPVGLVGLSLGGLAGALAATAPEQLGYAALVAPADVALTLTATRIGVRYRRLAALAGGPMPDDAALAVSLRPFDPSRRAPTARRVFLASGSHDRIVPPGGPAALGRAWGVPVRTYERGHMSLLFLCRALRRDLARFVSDG